MHIKREFSRSYHTRSYSTPIYFFARWRSVFLLVLIQLVFLASGFSQSSYTISGHLSSENSGEKLISANIYDQATGKGTLTNNFGFFSLTLPAGKITLVASYSGYQSINKEIDLTKDISLDISLEEYTIDEVEIVAENEKRIEEETSMSTIDIPIKQIKLLPALMGEVDVIKAIQLMPGVQSGNEGSSGLYVRGGGPDQNLILLDDVPLYYVSHLGGFFSVFNADAISSVKLVKGGFPARYGGRLSSVLDIRMKEGNMKKFQGEGSIGLISSKLSLQGPIIKDKTSFIVSARRTYLDLLSRPISQLATRNQASFGYYFYDLNAKINHKFSDKDRLYLSAYLGDDDLGITSNETDGIPEMDDFYQTRVKLKTRWGNKMAALRWNHIWSPKLFSNLTATFTKYRFTNRTSIYDAYTFQDSGKIKLAETNGNLNYGSGIRDYGAKLDFDFYPSPSQTIRFGINTTLHQFTPGLLGVKVKSNEVTPVDTTIQAQLTNSIETSAYVESEFKIGSRFSANVGLHGVQYIVNKKTFYSLQPRLSGRFMLTRRLALKASYVHMTQFIHLLANSGAGLPIDLWVPATDRVPGQTSRQAAVGLATSFKEGLFELSVEGYYKKMEGLIEYKEGTGFFLGVEDKKWEDQVETGGEGTAYGVEFLLQKKRGKTTGWVGYTLSWNNRQFENLNQGQAYPYKFDRRHDVSIVVSHQLTDRISIAGTWVFGTGNAITMPNGGYGTLVNPWRGIPENSIGSFAQLINGGGFQEDGIKLYENGRNGFRMQPYHRLDLGINLTKPTKWGERTWSFSVYNMYSRLNPYAYTLRQRFDTDSGEVSRIELRKIALFPIVPSVSYSFKF